MKKLNENRVLQLLICCCMLLCGASLETRAQEKSAADERVEVTLRVCTADGIPYSNAKIWDATTSPVVDMMYRTDRNGEVTVKVHPQSTLIVGEYMIESDMTIEPTSIDEYFGPQGGDYYTKVNVNGRTSIGVTVQQMMMEMTDIYSVTFKKETSGEVVYTAITQDAEFPGSYAALHKYLRDKMRYPQEALDEDLQGLVILRFAVEKDGSIGEVQIKKSLSFECDREAIRVVKSLPRFIPAKVNGVPVRKWITIPLRFIIQ